MNRDAGDGQPLFQFGVVERLIHEEFNDTPLARQYFKYKSLLSVFIRGIEYEIGDFVRLSNHRSYIYQICEICVQPLPVQIISDDNYLPVTKLRCKKFVRARQVAELFGANLVPEFGILELVEIKSDSDIFIDPNRIQHQVRVSYPILQSTATFYCRYTFDPVPILKFLVNMKYLVQLVEVLTGL